MDRSQHSGHRPDGSVEQRSPSGPGTPPAPTPPSTPTSPPLPRMPRPTAPREPPGPSEQALRSFRAGTIGAIVAVVSTLIVLGIAPTLTGGEGDLGPGLVMIMVGFGAVVGVPILAIVAIKSGLSALHSGRASAHRGLALLGVAFGIIAVVGLLAGLVPLSRGRREAPARVCLQPATSWLESLAETLGPPHRDAIVTESAYLPIDGNYYVALRFQSLETPDGERVPDATVILGTDREPVSGNPGSVWAASTLAWNLGLEFRSGEPRAPDFAAAAVVEECLSVWNPGIWG